MLQTVAQKEARSGPVGPGFKSSSRQDPTYQGIGWKEFRRVSCWAAGPAVVARVPEAGKAMQQNLSVKAARADELAPDLRAMVLALCSRAYGEELDRLFATFVNPTHVLGFVGGALVSHAMWVTRWLQQGDGPWLRTAYVEMVATEPGHQRHGFATAVLRRLVSAISQYDLGALCPAEPGVYARLGWVYWRGPLLIRLGERLMPTPEERIMILRLAKTPLLDVDQPLSAEWREGELW
jgi:aminoglycoside 2'-N-acetyltransferase I